MNKQAIGVISTFQQSSIWACQYYYSCKVVVIFFLGWYAYRDQETAFKQLCQVSDQTVNNALNCPCLRCKDCALKDWYSLHLSASFKVTLKAPTPAFKFVRHCFGHSVFIYKITKILGPLWLAERRVWLRVCKHGCDVKMFCFRRANHVSPNLKKFLSWKLYKFTLFAHSLVGWNLENLYKQMRI